LAVIAIFSPHHSLLITSHYCCKKKENEKEKEKRKEKKRASPTFFQSRIFGRVSSLIYITRRNLEPQDTL